MAKQPTGEEAPTEGGDATRNCAGCGKPMKRVQLYYRNGRYYCRKRCWLATRVKAEAPAAS